MQIVCKCKIFASTAAIVFPVGMPRLTGLPVMLLWGDARSYISLIMRMDVSLARNTITHDWGIGPVAQEDSENWMTSENWFQVVHVRSRVGNCVGNVESAIDRKSGVDLGLSVGGDWSRYQSRM